MARLGSWPLPDESAHRLTGPPRRPSRSIAGPDLAFNGADDAFVAELAFGPAVAVDQAGTRPTQPEPRPTQGHARPTLTFRRAVSGFAGVRRPFASSPPQTPVAVFIGG